MNFRQPIVFAGLGMVAGAASVAVLTAVLSGSPASTSPVSPGPLASSSSGVDTPRNANDKETDDKLAQIASLGLYAPSITGPKTLYRQSKTLPPNPDIKPAVAVPGMIENAALVPPTTQHKTVTVEDGDTLIGVLMRAGVDRQQAHDSIEAMKGVYNPRTLRTGDEVTVTFSTGAQDPYQGFSLNPDPARKVLTARDNEGGFSTTELMAKLSDQTLRFEGEIDSSLFMAANDAGVPPRVLAELIKMFSYDVDFQRDIQKGDKFAVMFKRTVAPNGKSVGDFEMIYASMTLSGEQHALYRYVDHDGMVDYYNSKGESVRKALLRTPINGARLSSGFGTRTHPVLGYTRMHKGVDFAAPTGTPIFAAGDGVIEMAKVYSGYGNYVRVRHTPEWATAYGHMSAYGHGITAGKRVRQGDVIGYVGATGLATGPHLHYEILKNGTQVNPSGVKFPTGRKLQGTELARFQGRISEANKAYAALPLGHKGDASEPDDGPQRTAEN